MVEPLALPKPFSTDAKYLCCPMAGPPFEVLQYTFHAVVAQLTEEVDVGRHHDVLEHTPVAARVTVLNRFSHHRRCLGLFQERVPFRAVEPILHFGKNPALIQ